MATLTDAQVNAVVDQKWDLKVLQARYGKATIMRNVLNKSELVADSGQIVHIPIKPRVTGGTVATDGGFTPEAVSLSDIQVNVNTWRYIAHTITDKQSKQAIVTLETELPSQFGEKLAEFGEIDLSDLFLQLTAGNDSGTPGIGLGSPGTGTQFLEDTALAAVAKIRQRQIPLEDLSWQLSPEAFYVRGWLSKERMTSAYATGEDKSLLTKGIYGFRQMILGIPAFESTLLNGSSAIDPDTYAAVHVASGINAPGTSCCALIHSESLAIAMQINNKLEKVRTTPALQLATVVVASSLYGTKVVRASHGVPIYISNS